jgi:hypothetical protein
MYVKLRFKVWFDNHSEMIDFLVAGLYGTRIYVYHLYFLDIKLSYIVHKYISDPGKMS